MKIFFLIPFEYILGLNKHLRTDLMFKLVGEIKKMIHVQKDMYSTCKDRTDKFKKDCNGCT